ncbi:MAG TPA: amidase, partial [Candidatus Binatia bacterium]|nr:amidase [Candidatus Binatia bacterium]
TNSVADAAIVLQAIAGYDPLDSCSADVPVKNYIAALDEPVAKVRVGILRKYFYDDLDEDVRRAVESAVEQLREKSSGSLVAEVKEVDVDVPTDRTVQAAESFAYHAGNIARSPELYQPETLRRIRSGEKYSAAEYIQRRRELDEERWRIREIFARVDVLITPATPIPAPAIAELKKDPVALRPAELVLLRNTRPFNVWGLPAASVPCGVTKKGLPIGLQIAAAPWREDLVLAVAKACESRSSASD